MDSARVSELHASLTWDGQAWQLRDRNSTNGTFVDGVKLGIAPKTLVGGERIELASGEGAWVVADVGPPGLVLEPSDGGDAWHVPPEAGAALFPSVDDPYLTVVRVSSHEWRAETSNDAWKLTDGAELRLRDRRYRVIVPAPHDPTADSGDEKASLRSAELEIYRRASRTRRTRTSHYESARCPIAWSSAPRSISWLC